MDKHGTRAMQDELADEEPTPRGSAEWYEWAQRNPACCNCMSRVNVRYIEFTNSGGWFCHGCRPHAAEIMDSMVE
jgi:hypothetical protein